jgi:hypothetical protein
MNPWRKFRGAARELGWDNAVFLAFHRALGGVGSALHRYRFVAQPVRSTPLLGAARGRSIAVRQVALDDPALAAMPLTREVIDRRASLGAVCFGAFKGEAMIGCLWLCFDRYEEDEVRCRFELRPKGRNAWDFDVYLQPDQRLGPGFARLWDTANAYMRERGIAWTISRISSYNPQSLSSHARLGAVSLGTGTFLCLGRVQIALLSVPPYFYVSTGPGSAPTLTLHPPETANKPARDALPGTAEAADR